MTIYALDYGVYGGQVSNEYVTKVEDIEQLAVDHYWGTVTEPEPGRLKVTVDMVWNTVRIVDTGTQGRPAVEYNILEFEQKSI